MVKFSLSRNTIDTLEAILLNSFLALFITISAYGQEMGVKVWSDFSLGLNTKLSAYSFPPGSNYATTAENIRYNSPLNAISKRLDILLYGSADTSEAITGMHRLYKSDGTKTLIVTHGDEIETGNDTTGVFTTILDLGSSGRRWQWLTWHDIAIGGDGYNQPVKTDGTVITYLGSCAAADNGAGAGPDGTYTYKVSYYTASYEVLFNQVSNPITVADNDIDLTMIPIAPDTYGGESVVGRKIYRNTVAAPTTWKLLTNGTIADNSTLILTDSDADGALGVAYPAGNATYTPPKGRFPLVNNNRLFFANDPTYPSRIYYSEDSSHDVFITGKYFDIRPNDGDEITFSKNLLGILTIGKNNSIQKLYTEGDDPSADWEISDPFSFVGCQSPYSAVNTPLGIVYLAHDGIYKFNGQYSEIISDAVTPEIDDIASSNFVNCWGFYHRNIYYLSYTSEKSGSSTNDRVLVYDFLSNAYSIDKLSINVFASFNSGTDWGILYSGSSENGNIYAHESFSYEIIHSQHDNFTGTWDDARLIPVRWGGLEDDPIIEIAWIETIDSLAVTIDALTGDINRQDLDGFYISQALEIGASALDKLYWNERIPSSGGAVSMNIRSGASAAACAAAGWSGDFDDPTGSDISGETANDFLQYQITMSTLDLDYTPTLIKENNYVVKLLYAREGATVESSVDFRWTSGWDDYSGQNSTAAAREKLLTKFYLFYDSEETGTITVTFTSDKGETDTFTIDLVENPSSYVEYFSTGAFLGELFQMDIQESSLNSLTIKKAIVVFQLEPLI